MWRSDTRNVAARASAVRLGQTEGGNARSRPYLIDDEASVGQRRELNAQVKRLPQRPRTHAKDLASVRQTRPGTRLGQQTQPNLLSGVRELSGAVWSCPVLACGGWAASRGLGCWPGVSVGNHEWVKVAER